MIQSGNRLPRRILRRALDRRRVAESDVQDRLYVRPDGARGRHVVRNATTGQEFSVSGPGGITYAPGSIVPTGRHTGTQGETILQPIRRGPSQVPPIIVEEAASNVPLFEISGPDGGITLPNYSVVAESFIGVGLSAEMAIIAESGGTESSPGTPSDHVKIVTQTFVSSTQVDVTVRQDGIGGPFGELLDLRVTRPGGQQFFIEDFWNLAVV